MKEEQFDDFIFHLTEICQNFRNKLNRLGYEIDNTEISFEVLESYILDHHTKISDDDFYDSACLLGKIFIELYGGRWVLDCNPRSVHYNRPVIDFGGKNGVTFAPFHCIRVAIIKQNSGTLTKVIESYVNP